MWIFLPFGFFTVVSHRDRPNTLIVRARVKADIKTLKRDYMPQLSKIEYHEDYDYPYRAYISHKDYHAGMEKVIMEIDYAKFKEAVRERQGPKRANFYTMIWSKLIDLENNKQRIQKYWNRTSERFNSTVARVSAIADSRYMSDQEFWEAYDNEMIQRNSIDSDTRPTLYNRIPDYDTSR